MKDTIYREDAIKAVEECLKLLARPRYTVKTAIEAIPSVDIPHNDDWEKYSDKLWRNAYERGKADRPQGWIPCSERLPSKGVAVLVNGIMYNAPPITISTDAPYYYEQGWINAWMPLPKPWKGADDDIH